jgi:SAM-dependent methyltransferase
MGARPWENWDSSGVVEWLDGDWPALPVEPALSALVDLVEIHHGAGPILEVGCGTGRTYEALMRRLVLRPHGYVGVDVTPAMVDRARVRYGQADFRAGDVFDLPFPDRSFGAVVCTDVLHTCLSSTAPSRSCSASRASTSSCCCACGRPTRRDGRSSS